MSKTARDLARHVLVRVDKGAYATLALAGELERSHLSGQDRALATELVYGTLKQRLRLDRALSACSARGLSGLDESTRTALRLGAYQILFLRVPAHAAVNDAVEAVRRRCGGKLAGFVNAMLRRLSREGEPALPAPFQDGPFSDPAALSLYYSLPQWLVEDALARFDPAEARRFLESLNEPPPLWLRLNSLRGPREQALLAIREQLPGTADSPGTMEGSARVSEAVRVKAHGLFTGRAYGEGWFTVQDLGAQLVSRLLLAPGAALLPGPILDACAGIGGKATHLSALTGDRVDIDAADLSSRKLELCADHAHRLGCSRLRTVQADLTQAEVPLRPVYAAMVLDAPCSGLGVLRRHPEARWRTDRALPAEMAALQRRLLQSLWRRLIPGGLLVYSVCTYSEEEGPAQIAAFLAAAEGAFEVVPPLQEAETAGMWTGLVSEQGAVRTWPHRDDADGFYAIRLRRR